MDRSQAPIVSVILPVFNCEDYICMAVASILNQTFRDFEFIIIDDGSTDRTPEILRSLASNDTRIVIITIPNGGYTRALLNGLSISKGKYIARMDADDLSDPFRFELQVSFLDQNPLCGVVGSAIKIIDPDGDLISHRKYPLTHSEIDSEHIQKGACSLAHPSTMIRRSMLDLAGSYRPEFEPSEDFDLWTRLGEKSELANLEAELLSYRLHTKSTSATRTAEMVNSVNRSLEEALSRRNIEKSRLPRISPPLFVDQISAIRSFAIIAWESGYYGTSRKHAWRQLQIQPFSARSWRCLVRCFPGTLNIPLVRIAQYLRSRLGRTNSPAK